MTDSSTPAKSPIVPTPSSPQPPAVTVDYYSPLAGGGSMLDDAGEQITVEWL